MRLLYIVIAIVLLLSRSISAQESSPWPPDPSIFAPGIHVLTSQLIAPPLGANLTVIPFNNLPEPLPKKYEWIYPEDLPLNPVTPDDGETFFMLLRTADLPINQALVVRYDSAAHSYDELGQITMGEAGGFAITRDWRNVGDMVVVRTFDRGENEQPMNESFAFIYLDNEEIHLTVPGLYARYNSQYNSIETFIPREDGTCQWQRYNLLDRTTTTYDYGTWCYLEAGDRYTRGYYRQVSDNRSDAAVIRFNPITGESVGLYRGEVEKVVWVDADERFAAFILDDNGGVDLLPANPCERVELPGARLALVNLHTEDVYSFPAQREPNACTWFPQMVSITPEWTQLLMNAVGTSSNTLMRLTGNGMIIKSITGALSHVIGEEWAVQYQQSQQDFVVWVSHVSLYNLDTSYSLPLLNVDTPEYTVLLDSIYALTPNTLQLDIKRADGSIARYMLYLPLAESPLIP